ncbi:MAG: PH domain-containing protein [Vampirovibrionales bacterium]
MFSQSIFFVVPLILTHRVTQTHDEAWFIGIIGTLFIILWFCFDTLLLRYLKRTLYKIYPTHVSYHSTFWGDYQADIPIRNILEVTLIQIPDEQPLETGSLFITTRSGGMALLGIKDPHGVKADLLTLKHAPLKESTPCPNKSV